MEKTILITGTSSGLGKTTSVYFAGKGGYVAAAIIVSLVGSFMQRTCLSEQSLLP